MILPHTVAFILVLMALSMFCTGSWLNTFKLTGNWRFELYLFDFAFGVAVFALICGLTLGNLGFDGFGLMDSIMNAGKQEWAWAFGAGALFYFGNMLLVSVAASAGMMVAFPLTLGTALVLVAILNSTGPGVNVVRLGAGCVLVVAAMAAVALGHRKLSILRHEAIAKAGQAKSTRRPGGVAEIAMAVGGGILLGCARPLLDKGTFTEIGMGPYGVWLFFAFGLLTMTALAGMLLLNLSLQGEELTFAAFVKSSPRRHAIGMLGGGLWFAGVVAATVAVYANMAPGVNGGLPAGAAHANSAAMYAIPNCAALLAAIWGIAVWREAKGGDSTVRNLFAVALLLFGAGVALVGFSGVSY